jgi:Holliday junction resolvasome RuvABC endonuclease subunit
MGVGVVETDSPNAPKVVEAFVVKTIKGKGSGKITDDDVRRMQILWLNIEQSILEYKPDVIGVEVYTVYKPSQGGHRGKGTGWKALYAYAMTCAMAFKHDIPVLPFMPADLHRRVGNPKEASKFAVQQGVNRRTAGLQTVLDNIPISQHEHAADACGHGLMALSDFSKEWQLV